MKQRIGYIFVFLVGFALCAAVVRFVPMPFLNGIGTSGSSSIMGVLNNTPEAQASPEGREQIGKALARQPIVNEPTAKAAPGLVGTSAVADAAAKVEPAVVNIDISGVRQFGGNGSPFQQEGQGLEQRFAGKGSGIILSADGYIVTNNHVVEPVAERGSGTISVSLDNNRRFDDVKIVGRDPMSDLAVLKVNNVKDLPAAALGDSDAIRVGDWAIAVGNPLGYNSTVTLGIISAVNRNFRNDSDALDRVIQTDAAINPGNSGGALADINGQVVGINTAIATSTGQSVGIGFAIPINTAKRIIKQLVENGKVTRPFIGIQYQPLASLLREAVKQRYPDVVLPADNNGSVILPAEQTGMGVVPGSPADRAGLRAFDVIQAVDGKKVDEKNEIRILVEGKKPGERVVLTVWRGGKAQEIPVTLGTMPQNYTRGAAPEEGQEPPRNPSPLFP